MGPKRAGGVHPYQAPSARGGVLALPLDNLNCARPSASLARHTSLPAQPVPLPVASAPRLCSPPLLLPLCWCRSTRQGLKHRLCVPLQSRRQCRPRRLQAEPAAQNKSPCLQSAAQQSLGLSCVSWQWARLQQVLASPASRASATVRSSHPQTQGFDRNGSHLEKRL
jgi:hypothetical protein